MDPRNTIVLHMINTYDRQCAQFVRPSPGILGVFLSVCRAAYRTWKLGKQLHLVTYHSPSGITGNQSKMHHSILLQFGERQYGKSHNFNDEHKIFVVKTEIQVVIEIDLTVRLTTLLAKCKLFYEPGQSSQQYKLQNKIPIEIFTENNMFTAWI